ncbi:hypothetical protein Tsubulata_001546 [Turnera subulata]|uniref:BED-type domain-containing protein n=1 Tax=Turnera subulata TaxID=218843 RepID=A0A9Q0J346_9ROSI|nr:hypothetical protein Tsubulata_001546 [Turnera subulata]
MASGEGSSSGASVSSSVLTGDIGPLWDYVTRLEKTSEIGGTWRFQCTFCNEIRLGTYSRVKAHLLQLRNHGIAICKKVTRSQKIEMEKLEEEFDISKKNSRTREVPLPCATTTSTTNKRPRASSST